MVFTFLLGAIREGASPCQWRSSQFLQPLQAWALGVLGVAGHIRHVPIVSEGHCGTGGWATETSRSLGAYREGLACQLTFKEGNGTPGRDKKESKGQKIRDAGKWGNTDPETWETRMMDTERRPRERPNRYKEAEQRPGEVETQEDKTPESNRDWEPRQGQKSGTMTETQSAKTDRK